MELLKIFDENQSPKGTATREDVHLQGLWHETFSCWFVGSEKGNWLIYFQLRSNQKENYPGLLDITAAGHLLADETVKDGVREVKEELGIDLYFEELEPLGVIPTTISSEKQIDREFIHTYLYRYEASLEEFCLQEEEVSGIVKGSFSDFEALFLDNRPAMGVEGILYKEGNRISFSRMVEKKDFVPHEMSYYERVIGGIKEYISKMDS